MTGVTGQRRFLAMVVCIAALFGMLSDIRALAQQSTGGAFDHLSTAFPLTGAHVSVDCESCHIRGRFKGRNRPLCDGTHKKA